MVSNLPPKTEIEDMFKELEVKPVDLPVKPEQPKAPEVISEKPTEVHQEKTREPLKLEENPVTLEQPVATLSGSAIAPQTSESPLYHSVERVLEEDLADVYFQLPKGEQAAFKKKGEATASAISRLLTAAKVKIKEVFKLILGWLSLIPHADKYFLEQEAKIKTDKLMAIRDKKINQASKQ